MDDINYSQKTIDAKPGETVRFVLKNEGTLMHEFNIGKQRPNWNTSARWRLYLKTAH